MPPPRGGPGSRAPRSVPPRQLAAAVRPHPGSQEISQTFKLPLDPDGFFLEAHLKLRPLDFATPGIFLCGLTHGPKYAEESIAQARGAAARALAILGQEEMQVQGAVARSSRASAPSASPVGGLAPLACR